MNPLKNKIKLTQDPLIDRRKFIRMGLITAAAAVIPCNAMVSAHEYVWDERELHVYNLYTYEDLKITYWRDGQYIPEALAEINHIFRDIRTGKVKAINKELLDLLFKIRKNINIDKPFQIVSGYRTPNSNEILRTKQKNVAKNSLHMYGKAVDIRIPGVKLKTLRNEAKNLELGGVGYYPKTHFVHVDVGEIRYWRG